MESEIKARFSSIITYWVRLFVDNDIEIQFPLDIIQLIVNIFLYENIKILKWHKKYKSDKMILFNDGKCAGLSKTDINKYVLADCDPIKTGEIAWRIKVEFVYTMSCELIMIRYKNK